MRRPAMQRQCRSATDVTGLRILAYGSLVIAWPELLRRKHLMLPCAAVIPLRADRNLERPHVLRDIDSSDIERERRNAMPLPTLAWRWEVAVPRLMFGALKRHVESDLHDLIARP